LRFPGADDPSQVWQTRRLDFKDSLARKGAGKGTFARGLIYELAAVDSPEAFLSDTPTAVLVRQVLGAVSQFEKASLVAKLAAARQRQRRQNGRCEGRKGYCETHPILVERTRVLRREGQTWRRLPLCWRPRA
jgi:hypothetical protein